MEEKKMEEKKMVAENIAQQTEMLENYTRSIIMGAPEIPLSPYAYVTTESSSGGCQNVVFKKNKFDGEQTCAKLNEAEWIAMKGLLPSFCSLAEQMNYEIVSKTPITCNSMQHIIGTYCMSLNIFEFTEGKKHVCLGIRRFHPEPASDGSLRVLKENGCTLSTLEIRSLLQNMDQIQEALNVANAAFKIVTLKKESDINSSVKIVKDFFKNGEKYHKLHLVLIHDREIHA